ncbi:DCC1-like thiol-disulfide oxidoreductase family protein [Prochlorococcus marinus]|nr:DCC1-like thiol-disulfide oxidoreductase family protein [Prochlorococcus marinus]KGG11878.1 hypothetical protein EV05_1079 [Prochlorococcus sp. MIT 0601]
MIFIYDGECPFCNHFAELLELKSGLSNLEMINGRGNTAQVSSLLGKDHDLDKGAILIKNNEVLQGPMAITWICSQMKNPSDSLLEILRVIFLSDQRSNFLFPLLIWSRRVSLIFKGVSTSLIIKN